MRLMGQIPYVSDAGDAAEQFADRSLRLADDVQLLPSHLHRITQKLFTRSLDAV